MNRRTVLKLMSRVALGAGATSLLPNCANTSGISGVGSLPISATKANPFVNSLGMKFVPVPGTKILMCTTETTVDQYKAMGKGYKVPPFPQSGNHPAVNVSWNDAKAWCKWISLNEGRSYRLPTSKEWLAAVGGSIFPWGDQWPPPNNTGNYAGQEMRKVTMDEMHSLQNDNVFQKTMSIMKGFSDRHKFTAPVGSYPANQLGIYDLCGNITELGERSDHGGDWRSAYKDQLRLKDPSFKYQMNRSFELSNRGFRCVLVR